MTTNIWGKYFHPGQGLGVCRPHAQYPKSLHTFTSHSDPVEQDVYGHVLLFYLKWIRKYFLSWWPQGTPYLALQLLIYFGSCRFFPIRYYNSEVMDSFLYVSDCPLE